MGSVYIIWGVVVLGLIGLLYMFYTNKSEEEEAAA
jgi:hypothetical protein